MPVFRLIAAVVTTASVAMVAPSWSADAPVPPPPSATTAAPAAPETPAAPAAPAAPASPAPDAQPPSQTTGPAAEPGKQDASPQTPAKPDVAAPAGSPPAASPPAVKPPSVTVIDAFDAKGILGRDVRSPASENMGRIVDVIVDRAGQVRAAVIDFGGFLGVGSRKIVVDWGALHFWNVTDKAASITLDLTREQVRAAPEYKDDQPMIVLGASGTLTPLRFPPLMLQEH